MGRRTLLALMPAAWVSPVSAAPPIRIGSLRFGSLAWELDVMRRHGLVEGFAVDSVEFAGGPASQVALQAGNVDVVMQDWLWTSRLRSDGAPWTFRARQRRPGRDHGAQGLPDCHDRRSEKPPPRHPCRAAATSISRPATSPR